ncbi:MAG: Rne/Rng family ribonuclease [Candidatus Aureabacteria bacterium]|nr:Rne/Rng family ribonuclease [Candidatus Auribacterota bacterium]
MFRIPKFLKRKREDSVDPQEDRIVINDGKDVIRVAIMRKGKLDDFFVQEKSQNRITGNIYKGRVEKIVKSIQAAFVNIGLSRNGFLHISDIHMRIIEDEEVKERRENFGRKPIEDMLKEGQMVLVQVIKDYIGTKGVRLSTNISLPGRYIVVMPGSMSQKRISRKIKDKKERERLKTIIEEFPVFDSASVIVRTAAENKNRKIIHRDLKNLQSLWEQIGKQSERVTQVGLIHEELDIAKRVVRDMLTEDIVSVVVDTKEKYDDIQKFIKVIAPQMKYRIKQYKGVQNIFSRFGIEKEFQKVFDKKIWLKCGGYIVIEKTEALVSVDVNTGRNVSGSNDEETIFQTNLEATDEIARQLRLRNLGGIIIIDYIDMKAQKHRREIFKKLKEELSKDKSKTTIYPFTKLGLLQMTRQRVEESWEKTFFDECPRCQGSGRIKSIAMITSEVTDKLKAFLSRQRGVLAVVRANPEIINNLIADKVFDEIEREYNTEISYLKDEDLDIEKYEIVQRG